MNPKILFTSPCGPYEKFSVEKDPVDYFYYRNTLKQKYFQLRSYQSWHSLHFLAQNIAVPSVVLENPRMSTFKKHIKQGHFEVVAIGFTIILTPMVFEMVSWLKAEYPHIEVVLGGYGTAAFKENFELSNKLRLLTDHICFGEGLVFFNEFIEKKWHIKPKGYLQQNLLTANNSFFRTRINLFKQIVLVGGLGCENGCSFCATSSQFNKCHIPLFKGKKLFDALKKQTERYPHIHSAIIYEEDFLNDKHHVLEFMKEFDGSELQKKSLLITVFSSVNSISKYTIEELVKCGIGTLFIGVESFNENVISQENLKKRVGNVQKLFIDLHFHGINTLGSLIIGWDTQSLQIAENDSNRFVNLNPTFYQVIPLHIGPGTLLWEKMKAENRIEDYFDSTNGIVDFNFETKNFTHDEALRIVARTYQGLVDKGGPWPFRIFENLINGYSNLKNSHSAILSHRAKVYKSMLFPVCILAFVARFSFFGKDFKKKWQSIMHTFMKKFPFLFALTVLLAPFVFLIFNTLYLFAHIRWVLSPKGDQPEFNKTIYNVDNEN